MFCKYCGAEIPDTSKFCTVCGARATPPEEENAREDPVQPENEKSASSGSDWWGTETDEPDEEPEDERPGRRHTGLIAGIIIAAVVVIGAAAAVYFVFTGGKPVIDLDEYVSFTLEGYNEGYGTLRYSINEEELRADYGDKLKLSEQGEENALLTISEQLGADPVEEVIEGIGGTFSRSSGLSNGDKVTFTWNIDKSVEENVDVILNYTNRPIDVEDLPDLVKFDAFEGVKVYFTGREPNGQADIQVNVVDSPLGSQGYTLDKQYGLSNGDIVTVTISEDLADSYAREQGKIPSEMTKEYMVTDLSDAADTGNDADTEPSATTSTEPSPAVSTEPSAGTDTETTTPVPTASASGGTQTAAPSYVTSLSQVPSDAVTKMSEPVPALVAKHCGNREELLSYAYVGCYLMNDSSVHNKIYLVYNISVRETYDGQSQDVSYYWFICYQSAMIDQYGNFSIDYSSYTTPEILEKDYAYHKGIWVGYTLNGHEFQYPGTATLDELISKMIDYGSNAYVLDSTVGR